MDLIKSVDLFLETPLPVSPPRHRSGYYPSSASCVTKDEYDEDVVVGKCLRDSYWACKAVEKSNPMTARGVRITTVGKKIEEWEVQKYKEMGIWRGNNIKFFDADNKISGEVDAFVEDNKTRKLIGVEIKTGYGYQFQSKVIGKPYKKGSPKPEHLMQVMLYENYFKDIPLFKLVYIDRGNAMRTEFDVTLDKHSGAAIVDGNEYDERITIPSIMSRYKYLEQCLEDGVLPPRDYQLKYSKERIQFLFDSNRLSKKDAATFEKTNNLEIGDWRCGYCDYKDYCWKEA